MTTLVFLDAHFAHTGTLPGLHATLEALPDAVHHPDAASLTKALHKAGTGDVLVHLHGAFVPRAAWAAISTFVQRGGSLVSVGRNAFSQPVDVDGQTTSQAALFRDLDIHEIMAVDTSSAVTHSAGASHGWLAQYTHLFGPTGDTDGFVLMPTKHKDQPADSGSAGPMDARIYPLVQAHDAAGHAIASPVVLIERLRGASAGARQIFVNITPDTAFWRDGGLELVALLAKHASAGVTEWWLKPDFSCYEPGETATLTLQGEALGVQRQQPWQAQISITHGTVPVWDHVVSLTPVDGVMQARITLPFAVQAGQYRIEAQLRTHGETITLQQGFWGRDEALLRAGAPLKAGRDYFERDGTAMPIVGMTYMASDVHRKFLQLPNVATWDADMATLAGMGVNYLRTGIWSAWRHVMFVDGHASEAVLRAIDAFILTAASHGLETCFTFFAFTPEAWEGGNPWLDPRSRAAQKRFLRAVASRHTHTTHVHWDLINEPSLFDPARIFVGPRTLRDPHEISAFRHWLQQRDPDITTWQARWDVSPAQLPDWQAVLPPQPEEVGFNNTEILPKQHGIWLDYSLFTQAMHAQWASDLAGALRALTPHLMVCVGQDEALGQQRPQPFFYADAVDYTTVHSWWLNDALAWDSLFSKTPGKPNLIQETGIMHVERPDGRSRRNEAELQALLERKYAYAYACGNAGAVQWIWNINYHMDNINESHIGACRADGSLKPEAMVTPQFGRFFADLPLAFAERPLPQTAVIYPFSNDYSNRRSALDATQQLARSCFFELGLPLRAVSDLDLDSLFADVPRLILLPCPNNLHTRTWQALEQLLAGHDVTILLTGPATLDEYWRPTSRIGFADASVRNLSREETLILGQQTLRASFGGEAIGRLSSGAQAGEVAQVVQTPHGKGRILWCPLPLELNQRTDTLEAVYREALQVSGVSLPWQWRDTAPAGVFLQKQVFGNGALWIAVSETSQDMPLAWLDVACGRTYRTRLAAGRALLIATDASGEVLRTLAGHPVSCD
ncbi:beta-galactosidase [Silvimonas iriomotensis]|uniref:Glycoside hydrolase family 42 N-terminal domain-containing protein n=1 Tax=Silvimonas iriomotensis TaxID=449662 RepID=A0ABQ2P5Z0_9NEIS|nr:beta-galactosidase [Silvimonas iriomotensis]GGP18804.1 hypothetical protein GCM10010970_07390 [Silvimonas iriomotensis]